MLQLIPGPEGRGSFSVVASAGEAWLNAAIVYPIGEPAATEPASADLDGVRHGERFAW